MSFVMIGIIIKAKFNIKTLERKLINGVNYERQ